jgi:hypothetical protein
MIPTLPAEMFGGGGDFWLQTWVTLTNFHGDEAIFFLNPKLPTQKN